jgi:hypothetical protein
MRKVGDAAWVPVTELATTEKRQEPFRRGYRWVVPKGQYDVRLQRTDEEADTGTDRTEWTALRSIGSASPYAFRKPLADPTMRIRAQDQLQGVIDTLTGIANSRCPDWDSRHRDLDHPRDQQPGQPVSAMPCRGRPARSRGRTRRSTCR